MKKIFYGISVLIIFFILITIGQPKLGFQNSINQISSITSILILSISIIIFLIVQKVNWNLILTDLRTIKLKSDFKITSNIGIPIACVISGLFLHSIILKPIFVNTIIKLNVTEADKSIPEHSITFNRPYHYSKSKNNPYFVDISIESNNFELIISPKQKDEINSSNRIQNLYLGKLGFYYLKNQLH
jgi:hypothetical protein